MGPLHIHGQSVALAFQRAQPLGKYRQLFLRCFGMFFLQGGHFGLEGEQFVLFGLQAGKRLFFFGGGLVEFQIFGL